MARSRLFRKLLNALCNLGYALILNVLEHRYDQSVVERDRDTHVHLIEVHDIAIDQDGVQRGNPLQRFGARLDKHARHVDADAAFSGSFAPHALCLSYIDLEEVRELRSLAQAVAHVLCDAAPDSA